jgi:hypothetical protein
MGAKPKIVSAAKAKTFPGARPGNGRIIRFITPCRLDERRVQAQIGSKNKDKKKLVMEIWYEFFHDTASSFQWSVQYRIKAQDKDLVGSGWHTVNKLASLSFNFKFTQGGGAAVPKAGSILLTGESHKTGLLFGGSAGSTALLPAPQIKHATGDRFGGSSGIRIAW